LSRSRTPTKSWSNGNQAGRVGDYHAIRLEALKEVGPAVFFSLLVIAVAFMPVFTLVDQEGRLFKPLAFSKTLAMALAAVLAVTLDPALRMMFTRMDYFSFRPRWLAWLTNTVTVGKYYPEEKHPVSRVLFRIYEPACRWVLRHRFITLAVTVCLLASAVPAYFKLGNEFMPPLNEGAYLYMPTALPGMSVTEAQRILQIQDRILKSFPEVDTVFGKAGRANSSTDPAPFSMVETTIILKPEAEWRTVPRWYSKWPRPFRWLFNRFVPERITFEELQDEMNAKLRFPGIPNIWTMPIKNRIDMLSTGVRTPIGVKVLGPDLKVVQKIGEDLENILRDIRGTRTVLAERTAGGYYVDFNLNRDQLARYGLTIQDADAIIMSAIGGENVTTTIEGLERYGVNVRYARDYRDDIDQLKRVLVPTPTGAQIPLSELADIHLSEGPSMIRNENGQLAGYVFVDMVGRDIGGYVEEAKKRGGGPSRSSQGLHVALERSVRKHGPGKGTTQDRPAVDRISHRAASLHEHEVSRESGHRDAGGAVLAGGRDLVIVPVALQHLHRRVGGHDRADGLGRGDGCVHAAVPRSLVQRARPAGPNADA
jgi:Cu(I)/Ag(I) efflux system membrane protein CusA/SilA